MPNPAQIRPDPSEYYSYYGRYVQLVPENDIVHALAYIIVGHERHHFDILKTRYL